MSWQAIVRDYIRKNRYRWCNDGREASDLVLALLDHSNRTELLRWTVELAQLAMAVNCPLQIRERLLMIIMEMERLAWEQSHVA